MSNIFHNTIAAIAFAALAISCSAANAQLDSLDWTPMFETKKSPSTSAKEKKSKSSKQSSQKPSTRTTEPATKPISKYSFSRTKLTMPTREPLYESAKPPSSKSKSGRTSSKSASSKTPNYGSAPSPDSAIRAFSKAAFNATSSVQIKNHVAENIRKKLDTEKVKFWRGVFRSIERIEETKFKNDRAYVIVFRKKPDSSNFLKGSFTLKFENGRWKVSGYGDTHWYNRIPD